MSGELGKQLEKLATDFNASQSEYRILPSYKGTNTETVTAAIFALRSRSQPAIVHVNEIATAGLDPEAAPKTWPELGIAAKRLRAAGAVCRLTTSWLSWINVENFSAFHNLPLATHANGFGGLDAELTLSNPLVVHHIAQLAEWQTTKVFDYSGASRPNPAFKRGECGIFIGSSATPADIKANANSRSAPA
jgi:sn-glycerol 3-phosphate transport system substrate-binding protein